MLGTACGPTATIESALDLGAPWLTERDVSALREFPGTLFH